jgi:hypothetical protein
MIPGSANPLLMAAAQDTGYNVSRSLRFNAPDSAYLSRTPGSAGNRKTWTFSCWVKRGRASTGTEWFYIFDANSTTGSGENYIRINGNHAGHTLSFYSDALGAGITTSQVFRDHSAWFHLVAVLDTTQATASDRMQLYINGSRVTAFSSATYPTQNADGGVNNGTAHTIGSKVNGDRFFDGYLAECHLIDGTALTASSFAETNATTGQWVPKAYTGSYGTNGFKLDFSNNASTATVSQDSSGNNNHWTANNISVTAGAGNDALMDHPVSSGTDTSVGGEVRGNYCTWNPLDKTSASTLANGNLDYTTSSANNDLIRATFGLSSGKWYWEVTVTDNTGSTHIGIAKSNASQASSSYLGADANGWAYASSGLKYNNSSGSAYGSSFTTNDVIGVAFDADNGTLTFYKNGTIQNSGTAAYTGLTSGPYFPAYSDANTGSASSSVVNFGARSWAYTAPSGFKALCDTNLPTPQVAKPSTVFDTTLYTGNGSARSITGLGFSPDLVWIKSRSAATDHELTDSVRGVTKSLSSNLTAAEATDTGGLTAFNSDGFSLGTDTKYNNNTATYAGWCWDAGSSTVTNTQGSITSSVRANASAGFSIVTYTGNGSAGATVGHGLGVTPGLVILKSRSLADSDWVVTHSAFANQTDNFLRLNTTGAVGTLSGVWSKTSTTFGFPTSYDGTNKNGSTYVAYCFAPVAGYSSAFSWTGSGSADGPFCYLGFRPALLLLKQTTAASATNWVLLDCKRAGYNVDNDPLWANLANAEGTTDLVDITSNGFKIRSTDSSINASDGTYVGFAWAEYPFQYARAR